MLMAMIAERRHGGHVRCWVARDADGGVAGVIVLYRRSGGRWEAYPWLDDEAAAPVLAAAAERGPTWAVFGPATHVDPLIAHLRRSRRRVVQDWVRLPMGAYVAEHAHDPRIRVASQDDLDGLVDLYREYRLDPMPAMRLWSLLGATLQYRAILVAEIDGRLAGAFRLTGCSGPWEVWDHLIVLPDVRREGVAWGLVHRSALEASTHSRRWMTFKNRANPMQFPDELGAEEGDWVGVEMAPRVRVWGRSRVVSAIYSAQHRIVYSDTARRVLHAYSRIRSRPSGPEPPKG